MDAEKIRAVGIRYEKRHAIDRIEIEHIIILYIWKWWRLYAWLEDNKK